MNSKGDRGGILLDVSFCCTSLTIIWKLDIHLIKAADFFHLMVPRQGDRSNNLIINY